MPLVKCRTLFNDARYVNAEDLIHRPSVYGFVIHENTLLVARASYTKRLVLPGGGVEKGEANDVALKREILEETGIRVEVREFLHFETDFFYYDPLDLAFHGYLFFYRCEPLTTELGMPDYPPEEGLDIPLWVDISTLSEQAFQTHGQTTMQLLEQLLT